MLSLALIPFLLAQAAPAPASTPVERSPDRCFRAIQGSARHAYLVLQANGRYRRLETEDGHLEWLDQGEWALSLPRRYTLTSDREAWALEVGSISVAPVLLPNVALVSRLKAEIEAFLRANPRRGTFTWQEISDINVKGGPCPAEDSYVCAGGCEGPWWYHVNTQPQSASPDRPLTPKNLLEVAAAIDAYVRRTDLDTFHLSVEHYLGAVAVRWHESGTGWAFRRQSLLELRNEIRTFQEPGSLFRPDQPSFLAPIACAIFERETAPLGLLENPSRRREDNAARP